MHPKVAEIVVLSNEEPAMADIANIKTHAEVIGADGEYVGKVECVEACRIRLVHDDDGRRAPATMPRYVTLGLVCEVEGGMVRLSANSDAAVMCDGVDSASGARQLPLPARADFARKLSPMRGDKGNGIGEAEPWTRTTSAISSRA